MGKIILLIFYIFIRIKSLIKLFVIYQAVTFYCLLSEMHIFVFINNVIKEMQSKHIFSATPSKTFIFISVSIKGIDYKKKSNSIPIR